MSATSNPSSPLELNEAMLFIAESVEDLARVLDEEASPFIMSREVGDVQAGVDEQSPIHKDILTDSVCEQLWLLQ